MKRCEGYKFNDIGEYTGFKSFVFVYYEHNRVIVYTVCGNERVTHTYIHELATEMFEIEDEPNGGGVLNVATYESIPSYHFGDVPQEVWDAVYRYVDNFVDCPPDEA